MLPELEKAILENDVEHVRELLEEDPLRANDKHGGPLRWAAGNNRWNCIELLLAHGANVNGTDADGTTALHRAVLNGPESVEVLIQHGANLNAIDRLGQTPLTAAIVEQTQGSRQAIELLLRAGAKQTIGSAVAAGAADLVAAVFAHDPLAISNYPDHKYLLSIAILVGASGTMSDRAKVLKILFDNGLKVEKRSIQKMSAVAPEELAIVLHEVASSL